MSDAVGQVIAERYQLVEVIGRGGHSLVFRARDLGGGEDVAIKVLHAAVAGDPEYTVRMVREHRAMAALEGTAAVRAFGLHSSPEGVLCLIMELLGGADLDEHLPELEARGERMGVAELLSLLEPIVDTLDAAHELGIVHRDLKPGNIYLCAGGGVRLLDFGLAKLSSARPLTRAGMIIGSPSYIAPEIWKADGRSIDHRVDIYSLGAIIFRALAGRVPFEGETIRDKIALVTGGERPSLHALRPDLHPDVDRWVIQTLAVDPEDRFFRIRAMWNALKDALGPRPVAHNCLPGPAS